MKVNRIPDGDIFVLTTMLYYKNVANSHTFIGRDPVTRRTRADDQHAPRLMFSGRADGGVIVGPIGHRQKCINKDI
jgi:hypothetical protein